jgi:hypothetical protein
LNKGLTDAYAVLQVTVSYLAAAGSNRQALDAANMRIHPDSILLDQIKLVNEQGTGKTFSVERVKSVEWTQVTGSEYNHLFKVTGHICFMLRIRIHVEHEADNYRKATYELPRSIIENKAVLVIPTRSEPAFTQVISQSLEWKTEKLESISFIKAG